MYIYIYIYTHIYIYRERDIIEFWELHPSQLSFLRGEVPPDKGKPSNFSTWNFLLHPVSVRRFPFFRTQPLESLTPLSMNKWAPEQPSPWRKYSKQESCYGDRVCVNCSVYTHTHTHIDTHTHTHTHRHT